MVQAEPRFDIIFFLNFQINCSDVVLFWRIQQVIKVTANALRQQVVNREARRVDKEIKEVLGEKHADFASDRLNRLVQNPDISIITSSVDSLNEFLIFRSADEFSDDEEKKLQLLTGKRVTLAEELSKLFRMTAKLLIESLILSINLAFLDSVPIKT